MTADVSRRLVAECVGTALLLAAVVGSGIMGERLAAGNTGFALLVKPAGGFSASGCSAREGWTVMKTIIFACVHNAGRSQMAAAFAARDPNVRAMSAGTEPGERVHPEVVEVMSEVGIDLSHARPQKLTPELAQQADLLITMGCGDKCPYVPGLKVEDWPLEDPKGKPIARVREIRDEIDRRVAHLLRTSD